MIILDTNVISELQKSESNPRVIAKLATYQSDATFMTAITVHEIWQGCMRLPEGARKRAMCNAVQTLFTRIFEGRILAFETSSAKICGQIAASSWRNGQNYSLADLQIAAIALHYGFHVFTRDINDFQHEGLTVINPWAD